MKALIFDTHLRLADIPKPRRGPGEVLIKVTYAGLCNTDLEITRGYVPGFKGILGHEFIGVVEESDDKNLIGRRVTGEINCSCGTCEFCKKGLGRHCPHRTVLGIINRNGAFAEYLTLPRINVVEVPENIPDSSAIFIEPLAAACEILEQVAISPEHSVLLIGDGKLALLIALVMQSRLCEMLVVGKHAEKLGLLKDRDIATVLLDQFEKSKFDVVIDASGNPSGFSLGIDCVKPRGTFVLKSTYAETFQFNPAAIVVNEITLIGSRCGLFARAIGFIQQFHPLLEKFISAELTLTEGLRAFELSRKPCIVKVVFKI